MNTTKIFAVTVNDEELPGFDAQALKVVLEAALSDDTPIFVDVTEVSISIPVAVDMTPLMKNNAGKPGDANITGITGQVGGTEVTNDVAAKNAKLRAEKGTKPSFSEKIKDLQGTPGTTITDLPPLKPTGEATPHNAPGKGTLCVDPKRTRESIQFLGKLILKHVIKTSKNDVCRLQ
jgi:hypothetical protein